MLGFLKPSNLSDLAQKGAGKTGLPLTRSRATNNVVDTAHIAAGTAVAAEEPALDADMGEANGEYVGYSGFAEAGVLSLWPDTAAAKPRPRKGKKGKKAKSANTST